MQSFSLCPFCHVKLSNYSITFDDKDFYEYCNTCNKFDQWSKQQVLLYCSIFTTEYRLSISLENNLISFGKSDPKPTGVSPPAIISFPFKNSFVQDILSSKSINKEDLFSKIITLIAFS